MKMRIELFYTYPHWFRLCWFGVIVVHTASPLSILTILAIETGQPRSFSEV